VTAVVPVFRNVADPCEMLTEASPSVPPSWTNVDALQKMPLWSRLVPWPEPEANSWVVAVPKRPVSILVRSATAVKAGTSEVAEKTWLGGWLAPRVGKPAPGVINSPFGPKPGTLLFELAAPTSSTEYVTWPLLLVMRKSARETEGAMTAASDASSNVADLDD